jgi:hypothetical protein
MKPMEIEVKRLIFFETDPKNLDEIKKEFLFSYWKWGCSLARENENPLWRELYTEVQKNTLEPVKSDLEELLSI